MKAYLTEPAFALSQLARLPPSTALATCPDAFVPTVAREWVVVVRPSGEPTLVACVLRDVGVPSGPSELVVVASSAQDELAASLPALVARVEQLVLCAGRSLVELQLSTGLGCVEPELEALGFRSAWQNVDLELASLAPLVGTLPRPPLEARWVDLAPPLLDAARGCYERAFHLEAQLRARALTDYGPLALTLRPRARLLARQDQVLAFARVAWRSEQQGLGEIRNLGRDPQAPQSGLGRLALAEAVRALAAMGARRAMLTTRSDNPQALALWEAFGFAEVERREVLQKSLAPASA